MVKNLYISVISGYSYYRKKVTLEDMSIRKNDDGEIRVIYKYYLPKYNYYIRSGNVLRPPKVSYLFTLTPIGKMENKYKTYEYEVSDDNGISSYEFEVIFTEEINEDDLDYFVPDLVQTYVEPEQEQE